MGSHVKTLQEPNCKWNLYLKLFNLTVTDHNHRLQIEGTVEHSSSSTSRHVVQFIPLHTFTRLIHAHLIAQLAELFHST